MSKYEKTNKVDLEHGNFFIEYFYSIGLDHETIFDDFLHNSSLKSINENPKLKPAIISKYPPVNKGNLDLDESLLIKVSNHKNIIKYNNIKKQIIFNNKSQSSS